jgi:hypothetical protein
VPPFRHDFGRRCRLIWVPSDCLIDAIEAKAATVLANFVRTGSNLLQTAPCLFCALSAPISGEITVKEHIILGIDERGAEEQRDLWLSENPPIKSPARASATKRTAMLVDAARE